MRRERMSELDPPSSLLASVYRLATDRDPRIGLAGFRGILSGAERVTRSELLNHSASKTLTTTHHNATQTLEIPRWKRQKY